MLNKLMLTILLTLPSLGYEIVVDKTIKVPKGFTRDNVKEIVTNNKTGLMWQDDASVKSVKKTWSEAKSYCQTLNYGGYSDWYLPSISELESIANADIKENHPAIKNEFENSIYSTISSSYWSSSSDVSDSSYAWVVDFYGGGSRLRTKTNSKYIRCVRAGQ